MQILFINPIGKNISLIVLDAIKRTVIEAYSIQKTGNDFEIVPHIFVDYVKKYSPKEIWCITGPGSFTLLRIITLILNSIAYNSGSIILKSGHYFDLLEEKNGQPILEANRHEFLIREKSISDILIKKGELSPGIYTGYIDEMCVPGYTEAILNIETIIGYFSTKNSEIRLSPLYIKPPNITIGSKKTIHPFS